MTGRFLAAILGVLLGVAFCFLVGVWGAYALSAIALTIVLGWSLYRWPKNSIAVVVLIGSLAAAVGGIRAATWLADGSELSSFADTHVTVIGEVAREPDQREISTFYRIAVDTIIATTWHDGALQRNAYAVDELIEISTSPFPELAYGDEVVVSGTLTTPEPFETDTGRTFDYDQYLAYQGIHYRIPRATIDHIHRPAQYGPIAQLYQAKGAFVSQMNQYIPEPESALAAGILLGVKESLGETLEEQFIDTGIIHIVVLSGYNVTIIAVFITWLLRRIYRRSRWVPLVISMCAIALFAILVGAGAPVLRASIMAVLALLAYGTYHTYDVLRALGVATVGMVLLSPAILLYSLSFQLSVIATAGLILLTPYVERWLSFLPRVFELRYIVAATLATQIAVLPLLVIAIGKVSVVAPIVNVLVLPLVPHAMLGSFLTGIFGFILPSLAAVFSWITYGLLHLIMVIVSFFAQFSFASVILPPLSPFLFLAVYGGGLGVLWWTHRQFFPKQKQTSATGIDRLIDRLQGLTD